MEKLDQQVHWADVAWHLGIHLAFQPPEASPGDSRRWRRLHLAFVTLWALTKHLRKLGASGTNSSPETYSESFKGQSSVLWHLSRDQEQLLCSDTAAELNSFAKAALGRLRVLGFPGLCANETVPLGRKAEGDGKQGIWGWISALLFVCVCTHLLRGTTPSHWVCWAHSGHGGSSSEDIKVNFTMCTERGPLASLFLNSHEITVAIAKVSET